ncbi:MAG: hypothetical protein OEU68_12565 [Nitrospira sp.]|jgi:hypothetical protein|nr:hypothetical protein [Nitrospira sp.]MDH4245239.1 hypothetical protein [Nitrospira sp.]MDH4357112.1 hypothetical protein [Nitrospira sp.]MDH5318158.1 hypothetical protein [Nitrospira sp.]
MNKEINRITPSVQARCLLGCGIVTGAVALTLSFGMVSHAGTGKLACKPDIKVTNAKVRAIKVLRFGYKDRTGKDQNEGLANKVLEPGETETWKKQKLQDLAEDTVSERIRVEFKDDTSGKSKPSDPWGKAAWSAWLDRTEACDDKTPYWIKIEEDGVSAGGSTTSASSSTTGGGSTSLR